MHPRHPPQRKIFRFTGRLAQRAGREKQKKPCGSSFSWYNYQIEVAHRTWEDHYTVYQNGKHVASFTDDGDKISVSHAREGWAVKRIR